uniref:Uncharacterized protein n=1 Tax=Theileria annulata TaxID=5874 RepID=A0A3B0NGT7_THEAN
MQRVKSDIMSNLKEYIEVELPKFKIKIESANENICKMEDKIINNTSDDLITLANFIKDEYEQL